MQASLERIQASIERMDKRHEEARNSMQASLERMDETHKEILANMQASIERIQASIERMGVFHEETLRYIARLIASRTTDMKKELKEIKELVKSE
jgi:archaellum component FlaC